MSGMLSSSELMNPHIYYQILFALVSSACVVNPCTAAPKETPSIGIVAPLTGPMAAVGTTLKNSVLMAAEKDSSPNTPNFIFEDDQFQPKLTVAAVHKLINVNRVKALVTFGSSPSLAVADIAERAGVTTISIAISERISRDRNYIFRFVVTQDVQGKILAAEARRREYRSIAILRSTQEGALAQYESFQAESNIPISADFEVDSRDTDLSTVALKILTGKPDAIFLALVPPQLSIAPRQLRSLGFTGDFFSGIQLQNLDEVEASGGALTNAWLVSPDDTRANQFYADYRKRFKSYPVPDGAYGYDIANLLIKASATADTAGTLRSIKNFHGLFGTYGCGALNTFEIPGIVKVISDKGEFVAVGSK